MNRLELKHLSPYLPYGLRAINTFKEKVEVLGIQNGNESVSNVLWLFRHSNGDYLKGYLYDCKPVLRPLSDLTKEIEVNGERFVPMIKLLYLYETNFFHKEGKFKHVVFDINSIISCKHEKYESIKREDFIVNFPINTSNMGVLIYSFTYDPELRRFSYRDDTNRRPLCLAFQLDLFEKLFEWYFDVFGLIEKGLAIDINTVNNM